MSDDQINQQATGSDESIFDIPEEEEGKLTSHIVPLLFACVIVTGFALLSWYAYDMSSKPVPLSQLPVIKASSEPVKIKPENPGGMVVPNADKTVYNRIAGKEKSKDLPKVERIMPSQEKPVIRRHSEVTRLREVKVVTAKEQKAAKKKEKPVIKPTAKSAPKSRISAKDLKTPPANKKVASIRFAGAQKGYKIQLAAFKTKRDAIRTWRQVQKKHKDLLGNMRRIVEQKDLGKKGIFYRLQAGVVQK